MRIHTIYIALFALLAMSCKEEVPPDEVVLPSNLSTSITIDGRQVDISASAESANFYTFAFFEGLDSTIVESTDGTETYSFAGSGTYTIRTRAHTSYTAFIEKTETVDITVAGGSDGLPTTGYSTPMSYPNYTLVWNDEFDGNALSSDWTHEIGTGNSGWGNNELQYYLAQNTEVSDGYLKITAKRQEFGGRNYTSSRLITEGKQSFYKGRIDIRAALPYGKGIWPALWMLGDNFRTVGWPSCGEIDIMEMVGGEGANDRTVHGTIHWSNSGNHANYGGSTSLSGGKLADEWHVFSIIWDENEIRWLMDDVEFQTADITPAELSEFHANFFFIFNVAVGGNWPGSPDASTEFPQTMAVDYIRVFQ